MTRKVLVLEASARLPRTFGRGKAGKTLPRKASYVAPRKTEGADRISGKSTTPQIDTGCSVTEGIGRSQSDALKLSERETVPTNPVPEWIVHGNPVQKDEGARGSASSHSAEGNSLTCRVSDPRSRPPESRETGV